MFLSCYFFILSIYIICLVSSVKWNGITSISSIMQNIKAMRRRILFFSSHHTKRITEEAILSNSLSIAKNSIVTRVTGLRVLLLLFIFSTCDVANASPLNKQLISIRGPFFQGWLLRMIDHSKLTSFIFIIGSFSLHKSSTYTEHYIFCGLDSPDLCKEVELFPDPSSVIIKGSNPLTSNGLNITWEAKNIGKFDFNDKHCTGTFNFGKQNLLLKFNATNRMSWLKGRHNSDSSGPEGWLGRTPLLPCHYFVHSVGSSCSYHISSDRELKGNGFAHIEGNHGTFFPQGWVWSQSIHPGNEASFSLVLGKFVIGGISPINIILYIRRKNGEPIIFRSTDLDQFEYTANSIDKTVNIKAFSLLKASERVELTINSQKPVSKAFGKPIFIPTAIGFSNSPGCIETYTAIATILIKNKKNEIIEKYEFPLTALEFGGAFVNNKIITNCKI